jgi:GT2 family glycosyltransferase
MDVSIVIASYNTAEITLGCIRSIIDQTCESSFEIIVVDNASEDGSPDRIALSFPQVRLVRNATNVGVAAAATQGLKMATGRYVLTMNTDVVILDGAIDKLVRFMDEHPDVGGATPKLLLGDYTDHPSPIGSSPTPLSEFLNMLRYIAPRFAHKLTCRFGVKKDIDLSASQEAECVLWGTCFIVRRETLEQVGYQDPLFFIYSEDVDWSMRIRKAAWKQWYVSDIAVIHYGGQSSGPEGNPRMLSILMDSRIKRMRKHYGLPAAVMFRGMVGMVGVLGCVKWTLHVARFTSAGKTKSAARRAQFRAMLSAALGGADPRREAKQ